MSTHWMQTSTGAAVDIMQPDPTSIRLIDIAIALARLPRFTGHTKSRTAVNVAEHSMLVELLAPRDTPPVTRLHLLLHDAHEMVTGDISSPLKRALREHAGWIDVVGLVSDAIQGAIEQAANLPAPTADELALIKRCDIEALAIEKRDCMAPEPMDWGIWNLPDVSKQALKMLPDGEMHSRMRFRQRALNLFLLANIVPTRTFLVEI